MLLPLRVPGGAVAATVIGRQASRSTFTPAVFALGPSLSTGCFAAAAADPLAPRQMRARIFVVAARHPPTPVGSACGYPSADAGANGSTAAEGGPAVDGLQALDHQGGGNHEDDRRRHGHKVVVPPDQLEVLRSRHEEQGDLGHLHAVVLVKWSANQSTNQPTKPRRANELVRWNEFVTGGFDEERKAHKPAVADLNETINDNQCQQNRAAATGHHRSCALWLVYRNHRGYRTRHPLDRLSKLKISVAKRVSTSNTTTVSGSYFFYRRDLSNATTIVSTDNLLVASGFKNRSRGCACDNPPMITAFRPKKGSLSPLVS